MNLDESITLADRTWTAADLVDLLRSIGFWFCPGLTRPLPSLLPQLADCRAVLVCAPGLDADAAVAGGQAFEGRTVDNITVTKVSWELVEAHGLWPRIIRHMPPKTSERRWIRCQKLWLNHSGHSQELLLLQTGLNAFEAALLFLVAHRLVPEKIIEAPL